MEQDWSIWGTRGEVAQEWNINGSKSQDWTIEGCHGCTLGEAAV